MNRLLSLLIAATLAGCASSGTQVSQDAALQFTEGVSTEAQIIAKLGRPTTVGVYGGMKFISYSGSQYQMKAASFIPVVGAFAGGADYTVSVVSYQIDKQGILQKISYTSSGGGSRNGVTAVDMPSTEPNAVK